MMTFVILLRFLMKVFFLCVLSGRQRITPSLFNGKKVKNVDSLPFDTDGNQIFKLKYNAASPPSSTSDGRPWNAYFNSKRGGFKGIRRRATCKGSPRCPNQNCWYKRQYEKGNRVNFEKKNGIAVCHSCNAEAEDVPCHAVKVWEVSQNKQWVTIYHHGDHTCVAIKKGCAKAIQDEAATAFQKSRQLKPQRYVNDKSYLPSRKIPLVQTFLKSQNRWLAMQQCRISKHMQERKWIVVATTLMLLENTKKKYVKSLI